jgi:hypothetical protein
MPDCFSLLGAHEVAALLGLTRQGLDARRRQPDFPTAVELKCGPIWHRDDLIEYACSRSALREERTAIARLAEEASEVVFSDPVLVSTSVDAVATHAKRGRLRERQ